MSKCLAIRWCAYGDAIYLLPTLEALKRKYGYLHLETGKRGRDLFQYHPAFDKITVFDIMPFEPNRREEIASVRWNALEDGGEWDRVINFIGCLEGSCMLGEHQTEWFYPRERRREIYGSRNFYDVNFNAAEIPIPEPFDCGTMYFGEEILAWMESWKKRHDGKFVVAMPVNGSTSQKFPIYLKELAQEINGSYKDAVFVLIGDKGGEKLQFDLDSKNVMKTCGTWSFLQSLAMIKMADYVIGPETGLMAGAGLLGTPKSMLCTSASISQANSYHKNDFSVQSAAPCSPCHRGIYNPQWCIYREHPFGLVPECNFVTDVPRIMEGVAFAHSVRGVRKEVEKFDGPGFGSLPELQPLLDRETNRDKEIQPGVLPEVREICSDPARAGDKPVTVGDDYSVSEW